MRSIGKPFFVVVPLLMAQFAGAQINEASSQTAAPSPSMATEGIPAPQHSHEHELYVGMFGGILNVKTGVKREVDKKGSLFGLGFGGHCNFANVLIGGEAGVIVGSAKGSNEFTFGDQTARIVSPTIGVNLGYQFTSLLSAELGLQSWLNEGANFSPEENAEKGKLYYTVGLNIHPQGTEPITFNLRYFKDINVKDREISVVTAGIQYQLPF